MNHIGIDLGTTNSVACTMKDGRFSFLDFRRTDLLPSVMMYQNGKVTVGEPAKRKREIFPNNYISSAKTHMGEQTADGKLKPVAVIEGRSFTATDVATEVLSEIYRVARKFFGNEEPIEAVITTPAYFDSVQNRETQKAGEAAGFQIKQILAEPVAAALAYALDDCHPGEKIFVVDLGGGTFDVTLLETKGNSQFDVIWKAGDNHLGGDDFDNAILEIMYRHIRLTTGTDVSEQGSSGLSDEDYGKMLQKLRREAERCKCELSSSESVDASILNLFPYHGGHYDLIMKLTRDEFLDAASLAVNKIKSTIRHFFDSIDTTKEDVDRVILVGGSARMPFVRDLVKDFFGKDPYADKDLAKLVAMGAAIKADDENDTIVLHDRITSSLGIRIFGDRLYIMLPKGKVYPCDFSHIFTTVFNYQEAVDVEVYVGEDQDNVNNNRRYGGFSFSGIEKALQGIPKIEVTFSFDSSQILHVDARDLKTGAGGSKEIRIELKE